MQRSETPLIIKICGITRVEDGAGALAAGADWLGLIRWPYSPRWRPLQETTGLVHELRRRAEDLGGEQPSEFVGVYVNQPADDIAREVEELGLDRVQLHGLETPAEAAQLARRVGRPVIKVIRVRDAESLRAAEDYPGLDILTDTHDPALPGGTGRGYDYELLREMVQRRRVVIAGGLQVENVGAVVAGLRPFGVDVSSGVELSPGIKDPAKVRAFIAAARQA